MIDETTVGLLEAAGPQMYRRNAFRITGLPTTADRRAVRQRQQRITPALELGADVDLGHSLPVELDDIRGAFDRVLGDPRRRLVDELFWLWDASSSNGTSAPPATCSCPKSLHADHDAAVRAHSAALDLEVENDGLSAGQRLAEATQLWSDASRLWGQVLRRAVFWDHVRHRIAVLDDRQLDESVIDTFRDALPGTLVKPLIELAAAASAPADRVRLAELARQWPLVPSGTVDDQLEEAAAPHYESLRATARRASSQLDGGNWNDAATEVYDHALPALALLESLVPYARHRRTASARNDVAVLLNNCATAAIGALGPAANLNASKWFRTADELATDPVTRQTLTTNRGELRDMMETFRQIQSQVDALVAAGRISQARSLLLRVKRQLAGGPGIDEIDRMLLDLRQWQPTTTYRPPSRGRALAWAVFALIVLGFLAANITGVFDGDGDGGSGGTGAQRGTAVVSAQDLTDNSPVGACIEQESDWQVGEDEVATVPCDQPHWGEVLAYVPLVTSTSALMTAEYPGINRTVALSRFRCEQALRQLVPDNEGLMTKYESPLEAAWSPSASERARYATCVVHWIDGSEMVEGDVVRQTTPATGVPVPMNTFSEKIIENAPVGTCIQSRIDINVVTADVPIVDCSESHWAEIVGYPVLYEGENATQRVWPGDKAVLAKAEAACAKVVPPGGGGDVVHTTWPSQSWWGVTADDSPIYAMCAVSRADDRPTVGGLR